MNAAAARGTAAPCLPALRAISWSAASSATLYHIALSDECGKYH
jgi:hypothetical protein